MRRWIFAGLAAAVLVLAVLGASGCMPVAPETASGGTVHRGSVTRPSSEASENAETGMEAGTFSYESVPEYSGEAYVSVNGGKPFFTSGQAEEIPPAASAGEDPGDGGVTSFEFYDELDDLGRCGEAYANIGLDTMPTEKRGDISSVRPSGWKQAMYDFVDGEALYNRCHLIGFQLTAENANEGNLVTGTRYLNTQGMLPFENLTADYIKETGNHVLYRVTPVFEGDELVCRGVLMEAQSVEDGGEGVEYCVFAYNVQPGVGIDYTTGESWLEEKPDSETSPEENAERGDRQDAGGQEYILNISSKRFHLPGCKSALDMKEENREVFSGTRENLIEMGYTPCGSCKP